MKRADDPLAAIGCAVTLESAWRQDRTRPPGMTRRQWYAWRIKRPLDALQRFAGMFAKLLPYIERPGDD